MAQRLVRARALQLARDDGFSGGLRERGNGDKQKQKRGDRFHRRVFSTKELLGC